MNRRSGHKTRNFKDLHEKLFPGLAFPTDESVKDTLAAAKATNVYLAGDGRTYVPGVRGVPKGMRYEKGRLIKKEAKHGRVTG